MLNDENKELCAKVLEKYGFSHQLLKLGEECTELAQVIFRYAQGEINKETTGNLLEEFIDVYIMQEELIQHFQERIEDLEELFNVGAKYKLTKALKEETDETD